MRNKAEVVFFMLQGIVYTLGGAWEGSGTMVCAGLLGMFFAALFALVF